MHPLATLISESCRRWFANHRPFVFVSLFVLALAGLILRSDKLVIAAPQVVFFQGFEANTTDWSIEAIRVASGTHGITSKTGSFHAEDTTGSFTRWGGYSSVFPPLGYSTSVDIYLNVGGGFANDTRFDWDSSINDSGGNFRRDFIFNGGYYNDAGPYGSGPRFVFSASNNSSPGSAFPRNPGRDPFAITASGWYTFKHRFYNNAGVLAVDLSILDMSGNTLHTWTLSNPADTIATTGGNRYGWFDYNAFPFLAFDNTQLTREVSVLKSSISDPLICTANSTTLNVHLELANPNPGGAGFSITAPILAPLSGIPGTCVSSAGTCTITNNSLSVTGNVPGGQTVTVDYKVQVANGTPPGANLCITSTGQLDINNDGQFDSNDMVTACTVFNCPGVAAIRRVSDQKAGSVLVIPYYTSGNGADTRITLTNTANLVATPQNPNYTFVHLMFMDGATCQQADQYVCLTPNASLTFKTSDYDPGTTGWILAVAVDANGVPIKNNVLIGNAFVSESTYQDNFGAEAFSANNPALAAVVGGQATLFFDGASYDTVPTAFAVEIQSPVDVPGQKVITVGLNGIIGSPMTGALQVGTGLVINGKESPASSFVNFLTGGCQATGLISGTSPRVSLGMNKLIPSGQSGTLIFNTGPAVGILMTPKTSKFGGIRTLHKTAMTTTTITIPVFVPTC